MPVYQPTTRWDEGLSKCSSQTYGDTKDTLMSATGLYNEGNTEMQCVHMTYITVVISLAFELISTNVKVMHA